LLRLVDDWFVSMYEAPNRSQHYPAAVTSLRAEGAFAVRELAWPAWVCPTNPEDLCVAWHPRNEDAQGFYCPDESALPCARRGHDTEIFVMDPVTEHALKFGPYRRQEKPRVEVRERSIRVTTDQCVHEALMPP
jgi:hypothetical protein